MLSWPLLLVLPLAALALLYALSPGARYNLRFAFFIAWLAVTSSAPIPLMLRRPRDHRNALLPSWFARGLSWLLGLRWELRGLHHVHDVQDGCVVLINHQSSIDVLVFAELWPRLSHCAVVSKKELFYLWPFGLATWLWGTIFIDRLNAGKARSTVADIARTLRRDKVKLCMFPEGTRSGGARLLPFKKGAFHIALDAQVPLLPIAVSGYYFLDDRTKRFDGGSSIISIMPPVQTKGLGREDLERLLAETHAAMQAEVTRVSEEAARRAAAHGVKVD